MENFINRHIIFSDKKIHPRIFSKFHASKMKYGISVENVLLHRKVKRKKSEQCIDEKKLK